MDYPTDDLTAAERERLAPHFTDLDGPVFALVNLPETVKGALFARYSRYPGTLRRLFLDEFADSLPEAGARYDNDEGRRAAELYERIFVGYGDDSSPSSAARTSPASGPRTSSPRSSSARGWAPTSSSPRATSPTTRRCPAAATAIYRDAELGPEYEAAMDALFGAYAEALPRVRAWVDETFPRADGEPEAARRRAVNAKAFDLLRGLLPAASLSHMGIYATGQAYEQLILHLIGHPLPEARRYGEGILDAIKAVMPSFVARVERPDRGGAWVAFLQQRRAAAERWAARLGLDRESEPDARPVGAAAARRRRRGPAARRAAVRVRRHARGGHAAPRSRGSARRSASGCSPTSWASARTAATGPAAASRRCATASRSSPTTARSATSSATAC